MAELLIVENDARILELMSFFLVRAGHRVRTASSFAAAGVAIREREPDLMLSDLDMGEQSGREELPMLASAGILPPTLVVSGFVDREAAEALSALPGVVGTLAKPFGMAQLAEKVEQCLALADASRASRASRSRRGER